MFIKTAGLVLREVEINEADKLLDILTRDHGLVTAKARGPSQPLAHQERLPASGLL